MVDYTDPVAQLLTYGGFSHNERGAEWPNYLELGFTTEHIPELLKMATDPDLNLSDQDSLQVWASLHAWRTLAQLKSVESAPSLVRLFDKFEDDDWLPTEMEKVFALLGQE